MTDEEKWMDEEKKKKDGCWSDSADFMYVLVAH